MSLDHIDDVTMSQGHHSGADSLGSQDTWSISRNPSAESSGSADVLRRLIGVIFFIAALNSGKHGKINAVDVTCNYCKKNGHIEAECNKKKREQAGGGGGGTRQTGSQPQGDKSKLKKITCFNCGKKGHMKKDCNSPPKDGVPADAAKGGDSAKKNALSATISDTQVADLMPRLKSGEIKLPCSLVLVSPKQHFQQRDDATSNPAWSG